MESIKRLASLALASLFIFLSVFCCFVHKAQASTGSLNALSEEQLDALHLMNYFSALTYDITETEYNRLYLQELHDQISNNFKTGIDEETLAQAEYTLREINELQMLKEQRERLQYIVEQKKAKAIWSSVPSAGNILTIVQSKNWIMAIVSTAATLLSSAEKYVTASSQIELDYLEQEWKLDDEETETLNNLSVENFSYFHERATALGLKDVDNYILRKDKVKKFIDIKNETNLTTRIQKLESVENTFGAYGPYWILCAQSYFENVPENESVEGSDATALDGEAVENYAKCVEAVESYENLSIDIFSKDFDYASVLPMAIYSLSQIEKDESVYIKKAEAWLKKIKDNTDEEDWALRYYLVASYYDLYTRSGNIDYLIRAYTEAKTNVSFRKKTMTDQNNNYLEDLVLLKDDQDDSTKTKKEKSAYNKMLKQVRASELPPLDEALYLNCCVLSEIFDIIEADHPYTATDYSIDGKVGFTTVVKEKKKIDNILHDSDDDSSLFLTEAVESQFLFTSEKDKVETTVTGEEFDGSTLKIPAKYVSEHYNIQTIVTQNGTETTITDWKISKVNRGKSQDIDDFVAVFTSAKSASLKYYEGDKIKLIITPATLDTAIGTDGVFSYVCEYTVHKKAFVFNDFQRSDE